MRLATERSHRLRRKDDRHAPQNAQALGHDHVGKALVRINVGETVSSANIQHQVDLAQRAPITARRNHEPPGNRIVRHDSPRDVRCFRIIGFEKMKLGNQPNARGGAFHQRHVARRKRANAKVAAVVTVPQQADLHGPGIRHCCRPHAAHIRHAALNPAVLIIQV